MVDKKRREENKLKSEIKKGMKKVPPGMIISVNYDLGSEKWISTYRVYDGSLHEGVGATENLSRLIAMLKAAVYAEDGYQTIIPEIEDREKKYLRWKNDLRYILDQQTRVIDYLIHILSGNDIGSDVDIEKIKTNSNVIMPLLLMIQAVGVSEHSIYQLSSYTSMNIRDCYSIGRSILETCVNICLLHTLGIDAVNRAERHALQKYFRDLDRKVHLTNVKVNLKSELASKIDPSTVPGLNDAIKEFSKKDGSEVRDWIDMSIDKKIDIVAESHPIHLGTTLAAARMALYRHSSEILHGTLFGVRYFFAPNIFVKGPASSREEMIENLYEHFLSCFTAIYFSIDVMIEILSVEYGLSGVRERRSALLGRLLKLEFIKDAEKAE
ncbi:hypothetical protein [Azospirillum sp. TSH58]|uniref:hypothetical protein n=1 Tax=Azospirillum sp. TSH58 TaxID=664962 RepID=UPI0011B28E65|nr:hypothetical protein [Azospirillum sp. TSH58]